MGSQSSKFLTVTQLAERYGVTDRTVRTWLLTSNVGLPAPVLIGTKRYFDRQKIEEWESKNTKSNTEAA